MAIIFVDILKTESQKNNGVVNMMWPLRLVALDIIVETAMGQESNIQSDRENEYAKAIFSQFVIVLHIFSGTSLARFYMELVEL
jgi:hypothetical protein